MKEEEFIFEQNDLQGNKWTEIELKLKGRNEYLVKNYYNSILRR